MNPYETLTPEKDSGPLLSRLHRLYGLHGYRPFRVSRFEKYELYAACKDFLVRCALPSRNPSAPFLS